MDGYEGVFTTVLYDDFYCGDYILLYRNSGFFSIDYVISLLECYFKGLSVGMVRVFPSGIVI